MKLDRSLLRDPRRRRPASAGRFCYCRRMVITIRPAAAAAALVLLIAACAGSGDAQPTESTSTDNTAAAAGDLPDPCALVAQDDVDAIFGGPSPTVVAGDVSGPGDSGGGRACSWSAGPSGLCVSVFVKVPGGERRLLSALGCRYPSAAGRSGGRAIGTDAASIDIPKRVGNGSASCWR